MMPTQGRNERLTDRMTSRFTASAGTRLFSGRRDESNSSLLNKHAVQQH